MLRYEAGMDWRRVDDGVTGDRKDRTISTCSDFESCDGMRYVRFVTDASYWAPWYTG